MISLEQGEGSLNRYRPNLCFIQAQCSVPKDPQIPGTHKARPSCSSFSIDPTTGAMVTNWWPSGSNIVEITPCGKIPIPFEFTSYQPIETRMDTQSRSQSVEKPKKTFIQHSRIPEIPIPHEEVEVTHNKKSTLHQNNTKVNSSNLKTAKIDDNISVKSKKSQKEDSLRLPTPLIDANPALLEEEPRTASLPHSNLPVHEKHTKFYNEKGAEIKFRRTPTNVHVIEKSIDSFKKCLEDPLTIDPNEIGFFPIIEFKKEYTLQEIVEDYFRAPETDVTSFKMKLFNALALCEHEKRLYHGFGVLWISENFFKVNKFSFSLLLGSTSPDIYFQASGPFITFGFQPVPIPNLAKIPDQAIISDVDNESVIVMADKTNEFTKSMFK